VTCRLGAAEATRSRTVRDRVDEVVPPGTAWTGPSPATNRPPCPTPRGVGQGREEEKMGEIVVVSGNPRPGSRTRALAVALGVEVARRENAAPPVVIDLAEYGPRLLVPDDPEVAGGVAAARAARVLVVGTPTYKGSYTGILKVFLDRLPHQGLAGVAAVPVTVAATAAQAAQSERHLRGLLAELGAAVRPGLALAESDLTDAGLPAGHLAALVGSA